MHVDFIFLNRMIFISSFNLLKINFIILIQSNSKQKLYTRAFKQYLICDLPAVLTIHLKRFIQRGYRIEKSNKQINYPLELDMSPYSSKMCINVGEERPIYSLYGIVEHSGKLNSGHYTAFVKIGKKNLFEIAQRFYQNCGQYIIYRN